MKRSVLASASKSGAAPVLEDGVDHAHVHQQAFGGAARICDRSVEVPLAIHHGDPRATCAVSHYRAEPREHRGHGHQPTCRPSKHSRIQTERGQDVNRQALPRMP